MNQEQFLITLASAGAVLFLIFIAWALGFRTAARVTNEADARRVIEEAEPGASVQHILLDKAGRAALARLDSGRCVTVRGMADQFAVRSFDPGAARFARKPFGVRVTFADIGHPRVDIRFDGAPPVWLGAYLDGKR